MTVHRTNRCITVLTAVVALTLMACSTTSYLKVTYQLPGTDTGPSGKSVFLKVTDGTGGTPFLGSNAKEDLKHFTGLFSVWVQGKLPKPTMKGAYDVSGLFDTAFRERLTTAGVTIVDTPSDTVPTLQINLTAFQIDMDGRQWTTRLDYVASMRLNGEKLTTQTVSGSAERAKIVGTGDAETLLGETVTTMVNQLDLNKLFGHPQL
ncbi:MAG: hypothetical protein ABIL58_23990 [Pseudomonadota bacterium]